MDSTIAGIVATLRKARRLLGFLVFRPNRPGKIVSIIVDDPQKTFDQLWLDCYFESQEAESSRPDLQEVR
jgi:hypothetical protein